MAIAYPDTPAPPATCRGDSPRDFREGPASRPGCGLPRRWPGRSCGTKGTRAAPVTAPRRRRRKDEDLAERRVAASNPHELVDRLLVEPLRIEFEIDERHAPPAHEVAVRPRRRSAGQMRTQDDQLADPFLLQPVEAFQRRTRAGRQVPVGPNAVVAGDADRERRGRRRARRRRRRGIRPADRGRPSANSSAARRCRSSAAASTRSRAVPRSMGRPTAQASRWAASTAAPRWDASRNRRDRDRRPAPSSAHRTRPAASAAAEPGHGGDASRRERAGRTGVGSAPAGSAVVGKLRLRSAIAGGAGSTIAPAGGWATAPGGGYPGGGGYSGCGTGGGGAGGGRWPTQPSEARSISPTMKFVRRIMVGPRAGATKKSSSIAIVAGESSILPRRRAMPGRISCGRRRLGGLQRLRGRGGGETASTRRFGLMRSTRKFETDSWRNPGSLKSPRQSVDDNGPCFPPRLPCRREGPRNRQRERCVWTARTFPVDRANGRGSSAAPSANTNSRRSNRVRVRTVPPTRLPASTTATRNRNMRPRVAGRSPAEPVGVPISAGALCLCERRKAPAGSQDSNEVRIAHCRSGVNSQRSPKNAASATPAAIFDVVG